MNNVAKRKPLVKILCLTFGGVFLIFCAVFGGIFFSNSSKKNSILALNLTSEPTTLYAKTTDTTSSGAGALTGGAIYVGNSSTCTFNGGTISGNKSACGGAIFVASGGTFVFKSGKISGNTATYGGAVYVASGGTFEMTGGTISTNTADVGGAIYVASGGKAVLSGGTISGNSSTSAPAVYVEDGGTVDISGSIEISDNTNIEIEQITITISFISVIATGSTFFICNCDYGAGSFMTPNSNLTFTTFESTLPTTITVNKNSSWYDILAMYPDATLTWIRSNVSNFSMFDSSRNSNVSIDVDLYNIPINPVAGEPEAYILEFGNLACYEDSDGNHRFASIWNQTEINPVFTEDTTIEFRSIWQNMSYSIGGTTTTTTP